MKKVFFALIVVCFSSCKKQFTCDNGETIFKGDPRFQQIKSGYTVTDYNGKEIHCY